MTQYFFQSPALTPFQMLMSVVITAPEEQKAAIRNRFGNIETNYQYPKPGQLKLEVVKVVARELLNCYASGMLRAILGEFKATRIADLESGLYLEFIDRCIDLIHNSDGDDL